MADKIQTGRRALYLLIQHRIHAPKNARKRSVENALNLYWYNFKWTEDKPTKKSPGFLQESTSQRDHLQDAHPILSS